MLLLKRYLSKHLKQILGITFLLFCAVGVMAQSRAGRPTHEYKSFARTANKANVAVLLPDGFKELPKNDGLAFDYGITIPDEDFEIWFKVVPQTEADPDSLYLDMGKNTAKSLAGDNEISFMRNMPDRVLADYGADAGKTYLLNLPDTPATKHYKYALLITLQKNHKGTIMAVAFTNEKGPDFFRNINKARNSIRFKVLNP
jgi:hypothetical protein